jgi:hypothetical protein
MRSRWSGTGLKVTKGFSSMISTLTQYYSIEARMYLVEKKKPLLWGSGLG